MLGMFIAGPAAAFGKKGMRLGFYIFSCLNAFYTMTALSIWCIFVFNLFSGMESAVHPLLPLLWANAVAIIPVLGISNKDLQSGNSFTLIAAFFCRNSRDFCHFYQFLQQAYSGNYQPYICSYHATRLFHSGASRSN
ncbi:MAG: hypothetical protein IMF07_07800 [Proteobacteria bacterium]|nr:hypothetical protein [Pseudomonadota bacterium]